MSPAKLYLIFFKTNSPGIETFYKAVEVPIQDIASLKNYPLSLSIDGEKDYDYAYLNAGGASFLFRVPHSPRIIYYPGDNFPKYSYTSVYNNNWQVTSLQNQTEYLYRKVIMVNEETLVAPNQEQIDKSKFKELGLGNQDEEGVW